MASSHPFPDEKKKEKEKKKGPSSDEEGGMCGVYCCLLVVFFALGLVVYLWTIDYIFKPQNPQFKIDSASMYGVTVTDSQITASWNITLVTVNPNLYLDVDYLIIDSFLYYGDKKDVSFYDSSTKTHGVYSIAAKSLCKPFILDKGGNQSTLVDFKLAVQSKDICCDILYGHEMAKDVLNALAHGGTVKFGLYISLYYHYSTNYMSLGLLRPGDDPRGATFSCNRVEFVFAPNNNGTGIFKGLSRDCREWSG